MARPNIEIDTKWLEEVVDKCIPNDIPPTPLRSSASLRSSLKSDICSLLEMKELQQDLTLGITGFEAYCDRTYSPDQSEKLKKELEQVGQTLITTPPSGEGSDLATLFQISKPLLSVLNEAGSYYYQEAQYSSATGIYTLLTMLQHTDAQHFCYRALCCQAQARYSEALAAFDWAYQLSKSPGVTFLIADCLLESGDKQAALEEFNSAQAFLQHDAELDAQWKDYAEILKTKLS